MENALYNFISYYYCNDSSEKSPHLHVQVRQSVTFNLQVYIVYNRIASTLRILGFTGVLIFV